MQVKTIGPLPAAEEGKCGVSCPRCGNELDQWQGFSDYELPVNDPDHILGYTNNYCMECKASYTIVWTESDSLLDAEIACIVRDII